MAKISRKISWLNWRNFNDKVLKALLEAVFRLHDIQQTRDWSEVRNMDDSDNKAGNMRENQGIEMDFSCL